MTLLETDLLAALKELQETSLAMTSSSTWPRLRIKMAETARAESAFGDHQTLFSCLLEFGSRPYACASCWVVGKGSIEKFNPFKALSIRVILY